MARKRKARSGRPTLAGGIGSGESRRVGVRLTEALITAAKKLRDRSVGSGVRAALEISDDAGTKTNMRDR